MNKKEKLKNILLLSIFILNDSEYKKLEYYLNNNKLNKARILIDDLSELKEIDIFVNSNNQKEVEDYKKLNEIYDLIIDLIVNENVNGREKQFEQNIKQL